MAVKHDYGIAERFKIFRKKYIDKSGIVAAEELGISQASISRIEIGDAPVNAPLIKTMVNKFALNRDWLLDNIGNPIKEQVKVKPSLAHITELQDKVSALTTEIRILNKNQTKLWEIIEVHTKLLEELRNDFK